MYTEPDYCQIGSVSWEKPDLSRSGHTIKSKLDRVKALIGADLRGHSGNMRYDEDLKRRLNAIFDADIFLWTYNKKRLRTQEIWKVGVHVLKPLDIDNSSSHSNTNVSSHGSSSRPNKNIVSDKQVKQKEQSWKPIKPSWLSW